MPDMQDQNFKEIRDSEPLTFSMAVLSSQLTSEITVQFPEMLTNEIMIFGRMLLTLAGNFIKLHQLKAELNQY